MRGTWIAGLVLLGAVGALPRAAESGVLRAVQVFVAFEQRIDSGAREEYLREQAGTPVTGAGTVEAVIPRTFYDSSISDRNPAVVLLYVSAGRKVACGLPAVPDREALSGVLREGKRVSFRGVLADIQDWGRWTTLYLSDCSVHGMR